MHYFKLFAILSLLLCFTVKGEIMPHALFGPDHIVEIEEAKPELRKVGQSVAMLVSNLAIKENDRSFDLDPSFFPLASQTSNYRLCKDTRFSDQRANPVSCTGFLVGEDLLMTAGHCVLNFGHLENERNHQCADFSWVFGLDRRDGKPVKLNRLSKSRLYRCKKIIKASFDLAPVPINSKPYDHDYALIQLDRKVVHRSFLKLSDRAVRVGEQLSVVGHPLGLPKKAATHGRVNVNSHPYYFEVGIDSFSGNSGSPLLDRSGEVVGILVRGPEDGFYDESKGCYRYNRCNILGKRCSLAGDVEYQDGMHGQRVDFLKELLP